jgi:hypothetical protein
MTITITQERRDLIDKKIMQASSIAYLIGQAGDGEDNPAQRGMAAWLLQDMLEDIHSLVLHQDKPAPADAVEVAA